MEVMQTAQHHDRHRVDDLETCDVAQDHERQHRCSRRHRNGQRRREPILCPAPDELGAEGRGSPVEPELLEAIDQHDAVAGGDTQQPEERDQRAERERSAVDERRQHPADESHRQGEESQPRQTPAPECGLEEQEDGDQGCDTEAHDPPQADLLGRSGLLDHLGVVFEWELAVREAIFDVGGHCARGCVR